LRKIHLKMNYPASARNVKTACEAVGTSSAFHPVDNFPAKGPCKINGYGVRRGPFHVFIGAILPSSLSDLGDRHEKMGNLGQIYRFRSRFISKSDRLFAALIPCVRLIQRASLRLALLSAAT
jgi:hypothetical protein